jgi:hypothetical protein
MFVLHVDVPITQMQRSILLPVWWWAYTYAMNVGSVHQTTLTLTRPNVIAKRACRADLR